VQDAFASVLARDRRPSDLSSWLRAVVDIAPHRCAEEAASPPPPVTCVGLSRVP